MHVKAWMRLQPGLYLNMLMGRIVVGDQMDDQILAAFPVDFLRKAKLFLMPVLLGDGRDEFAFEIVQCRKQREGAMTNVVMGCGLDVADAHGKPGLGAL